MTTRTHEDDLLAIPLAFDSIDEQEVATDVAFAMIAPFPSQWMIQPLRAKGPFVGDQQKHCIPELLPPTEF